MAENRKHTMKILTKVRLLLANVDPAMNVINVAGRSGMEYQFSWDAALGMHSRVYDDFDKAGEVERLNAEGTDLAEAVMPPGWTFQRAFVFEDAELVSHEGDGDALKVAGLLRLAILRLMARTDPEAAKASFSKQDWESMGETLAGRANEVFERFGIEMPDWDGARLPMQGEGENGTDATDGTHGGVRKRKPRAKRSKKTPSTQ